MSTKRFRIAFSFAGEKRPFVAEVANILATHFGEDKILYDKYHEAEFARRDLSIYLPNLYNLETDLIVVIACPHYDKKEWTGLEWLAIHDLLQQRRNEEVMLCRFDRAQVEGLYRGAGFVELDSATPEKFVTNILERLAINEGNPKDHYTKPTGTTTPLPLRTTIPNNLPALQPFFGREDELKKIAEALEPESRTWGALIDGPGGMGKTSLAVFAAFCLPPGSFDKIAFVSLKPRELDEDGVRDLSGFLIEGLYELLNELARLLKHTDIAKEPENKRPQMLLDALNGTKTLLILDNLESLTKAERDTVFTFVKRLPQGCKAILTSRLRIGSTGEELILEKLSEAAALETLADLATHNPDIAKTTVEDRIKLYKQTAGKPLLLKWTAGQIGRRHCITIDDAIAYLRSCPAGNDPLEFIFGDLVEDFSEAETKVLCALTYFTLPAKVEHIAPLAECTEEATRMGLQSLTNRSLVVPSEEFMTFTLVPLVADFLQKKKPEVVTETGDRLEKQAYALIIENGYDEYGRFPILSDNWPMVAAALPKFLTGTNDTLQVVCNALQHFLHFTGRWDEWLALSLQAETIAVANNDFEKAGWRAYQAGWVGYLRRQPTEILIYADRAAAHWEKANAGAREKAVAIRLRGKGYYMTKDYNTAITAYEEALDLDKTINPESDDVTIGLNDLAMVKQKIGQLDAAELDYREALRIATIVDYQEGIATYTGNLAELLLKKEDWQEAETLAREALSLSEKVGRLELMASNCNRLALALIKQDKKEEAIPYAKRALDIFTQLGLQDDIDDARKLLAQCEV